MISPASKRRSASAGRDPDAVDRLDAAVRRRLPRPVLDHEEAGVEAARRALRRDPVREVDQLLRHQLQAQLGDHARRATPRPAGSPDEAPPASSHVSGLSDAAVVAVDVARQQDAGLLEQLADGRDVQRRGSRPDRRRIAAARRSAGGARRPGQAGARRLAAGQRRRSPGRAPPGKTNASAANRLRGSRRTMNVSGRPSAPSRTTITVAAGRGVTGTATRPAALSRRRRGSVHLRP